MDAGRPMNMATHQGQGDGGHPPQYISSPPPPPTTSHPGIYLPPPPSHMSAPHATIQGPPGTYPPSTVGVGMQEILNLAAATTREHPAFPGLPSPHHLQAVAQQQAVQQVVQQQAAVAAVQAVAQQAVQQHHHQQQPMELDLRGQVQHVQQQQQQRSAGTPGLHHQQPQPQQVHPQQVHHQQAHHLPAKLNIKTEMALGDEQNATWQQVPQSQPHIQAQHQVPSTQTQQQVGQQTAPQQPVQAAQSELDLLQMKIQSMDPISVWNLVRVKILPCLTPWDFVCDRTRLCGSKGGQDEEDESSPKLPTSVAKLKFLLQEMNDLAEELAHLVENCCETVELAEVVPETPMENNDAKGSEDQQESEEKSKDVNDSQVKDEMPEKVTNGEHPPAPPEIVEVKDGPTSMEVGDKDTEGVDDKAEESKVEEILNPEVVSVDEKVRHLLGNSKILKIKPKELSQMAAQYQGLFDEYYGPPINIKLESESLEVECNPYTFNSASIKQRNKVKKKEKEKRQRGPPYRCSVCTKTFPNRNRYNYHQKKSGACPGIPVDPKPHKYVGNRYYCIHKDCLPEGAEINVDIHPQYTNRTQYWKHFAEAHGATVEHTYTCNYCAEVFPLKEMHDYHVKSKHERSHTFGYCGNRFSERRTLVKHERCHTGEKPYACDSCDFRCSSSSSLCQHKRRRHDPAETGRKHICEQCGKGFYTRDNLKEHIATHSNTKMFSCYICGKGLKNDSCYRRHMVCVHGLKHTCDLCGKDFSSPVGLKHHQRGAHGILF